MLVLVKLVMAEDWTAQGAGTELVRQVADPAVIAQLAARVGVAQAERPSALGLRARQTLDHAEARIQAA